MNPNIIEIKKRIEEDLELLGYSALRHSLFEGEDNKAEHQIRIEYINNLYEVYITVDRYRVLGKHVFEDEYDAYKQFLLLSQSMVLRNRKSINKGKNPLYPSYLWSEKN